MAVNLTFETLAQICMDRLHEVTRSTTVFNLRYALDINIERAEDVLTHKRLLQLVEDPTNRPAFDVWVVN